MLRAVQGIQVGAHFTDTPHGHLMHATQLRDAPAPASADPSRTGPAAGRTAMDGAAAAVLIELRVATPVQALREARQRWRAAGLAEFALLDVDRTEEGAGVMLSVLRAPSAGAMTVRTAVHDGVRCFCAGLPCI